MRLVRFSASPLITNISRPRILLISYRLSLQVYLCLLHNVDSIWNTYSFFENSKQLPIRTSQAKLPSLPANHGRHDTNTDQKRHASLVSLYKKHSSKTLRSLTNTIGSCRTICEHPATPHHVPNLIPYLPVPSNQDPVCDLLFRPATSRCPRKHH
jgi:hypothetical protein